MPSETQKNSETTPDETPSTIEQTIQTKQPRRLLFIIIGIVILLALIASFIFLRPGAAAKVGYITTNAIARPIISTAPPEEKKVVSVLDGTLVSSSVANRRPLAIMVENHPDARPQFGLSKASVVYEAIAEGGITRFMAIFGPQSAAKVGPVRSSRTYYLDWALEYDAAYAHVGGNRDALDLIPQLKIKDLDQFSVGDAAYRREPHGNVAIEHTMYTDTDKLWSLADQKFGQDQHWTGPTFKEPTALEHRPTSQTVTIDFSAPAYLVKWTYDPTTNTYLRSLAGSFHKDAGTGETLRASTIFIQVVQRQPTTTRDGEAGYTMTTLGSGKGQVIEDGQRIEATWKKESHTAPTIFYDPSGKEIARNPGQTWVEIVPPESTIKVE